MKKKNKRWRLIADVRVQGILCLRVSLYWLTCQLLVLGSIAGTSLLEGPGSSSVKAHLFPAFIIGLLALPIALFDMIKFSNRFAGPVLNFRKRFRGLAQDHHAEPIHFRKGDYWGDLGENFNQLIESIEFNNHESGDAGKIGGTTAEATDEKAPADSESMMVKG